MNQGPKFAPWIPELARQAALHLRRINWPHEIEIDRFLFYDSNKLDACMVAWG